MTSPNEELIGQDGVEVIVLAKLKWPVPEFAVEQLRIITKRISTVMKAIANAPQIGGAAVLDEDSMDALITVLLTAVQAGTPAMKKPEFEKMKIGLLEMFNALPIVIKQCGMEFAKPEEKQPGEAEASPTLP